MIYFILSIIFTIINLSIFKFFKFELFHNIIFSLELIISLIILYFLGFITEFKLYLMIIMITYLCLNLIFIDILLKYENIKLRFKKLKDYDLYFVIKIAFCFFLSIIIDYNFNEEYFAFKAIITIMITIIFVNICTAKHDKIIIFITLIYSSIFLNISWYKEVLLVASLIFFPLSFLQNRFIKSISFNSYIIMGFILGLSIVETIN